VALWRVVAAIRGYYDEGEGYVRGDTFPCFRVIIMGYCVRVRIMGGMCAAAARELMCATA